MISFTTPVTDRLAAVAESVAAQLPAEAASAFQDEQAELDATALPARIAAPGTPMPDAALLDVHGGSTSLTEARQGRPAVVVFYRGAWCPYCNATLRTYQQVLAGELERRGVVLIAVSPQKPDGSLTMQETNELSFTVLSDPGNQIGAELGIVTRPSDGVLQTQASLGLDLTAVNADGTHGIVMPTVAVTDASGLLRWIDVHVNYTKRTEPAQILEAVDSLL